LPTWIGVGLGVLVMVGEAVWVGASIGLARSGFSMAGKSVVAGLVAVAKGTAVADGAMAAPPPAAPPSIAPPPVAPLLPPPRMPHPADNTIKISPTTNPCFGNAIPSNPLPYLDT
jgi:hypothetical protein